METAEIIKGIVLGFVASGLFVTARYGWFSVQEGYLASLTTFGKAEREQGSALKVYKPGFYFKWPWEVVHQVSVMEKRIRLVDGSSNQNFEVLAYDGTVLSFEVYARVKANTKHVEKILYTIRDPEAHVLGYLKSIFRNTISNYGKELEPGEVSLKIRTDLTSIDNEIKNQYQSIMNDKYGIEFLGLDIVDMSAPESLNAALNSVQTAEADAEYIIAKALASKEVTIIASQERLRIATTESEAVKKEILSVGEYLHELVRQGKIHDYIERRRTEIFNQSKLTVLNKGAH